MNSRTRIALVGAAAVSLLAAGSALAAPKASCNLIEDEKGDTFAIRTQDSFGAYGPQENALDIVSGDLASDGTVLTAVLRVEKLALSTATAPNGISFRVQFAHDGLDEDTVLYVDARASGGSTVFTAGSRNATTNVSTKLADATGVFDEGKNEVRIHAPLKVFAGLGGGITTSTRLTLADLDQTSSRFVGTNPVTGAGTAVFADVTRSDKTYKVGSPSCVVPGK
jgi:hypothetical protein